MDEAINILYRLRDTEMQLAQYLKQLEDVLITNIDVWGFPVDNPADWYCAVWHDLTGARNGGYKHTGIDLNLDKAPWGDVERGMPIKSLAAGTVTASASSAGWLGVVQIQHQHNGLPLWVRYAHFDPGRIMVNTGDAVQVGQVLGYVGNWTGGDGGDHLHLDMATSQFHWARWLSADDWIDPVPVLKAHLLPAMVDSLLARDRK